MFCSWYDDVDIALSMIDTEYPRLSQICCHGNCCRLSTDNLCAKMIISLNSLSSLSFEILHCLQILLYIVHIIFYIIKLYLYWIALPVTNCSPLSTRNVHPVIGVASLEYWDKTCRLQCLVKHTEVFSLDQATEMKLRKLLILQERAFDSKMKNTCITHCPPTSH
jgi:hypothetical protein